MAQPYRRPLSAILGPTNTGKTHLAVERMLGHSSGMMAFPLRLLAREVYDRVVAQKGVGAVALVTGEERIWPDTARYILSTAEAMPVDARVMDSKVDGGTRDVGFLALDEAQLGQDRERGHIFTGRLLHARGRDETMILGSGSLAPVVRALLPDAEITSRPRFSTLSYDGPRKLSRLPPRSAIVAFSAEEVYAIAEALRRFSGGAAVVMGALSPRTRNAQVAMFQAGEVDYLVATDAIGMGLNLDVSHVAFAGLSKFDGIRQRRLTVPEMAQIAGRAGRHQRDGTFGSIGANTAFTPEEIANLEEHRFAPLDWLYWRNPYPGMDSVAELIADLEQMPDGPALRSAPEASDMGILRRLAGEADAMALVTDADAVRRFWSVCSLPDFRKSGIEAHGRFVARLWRDLGRNVGRGNGHIDADWFVGQLRNLDSIDGSVEALADRIAGVRSYCYIAQRKDWLAEPEAMAARAHDLEARLSDGLHQALTARFVDRRTTVLLRGLGQDGSALPVTVDDDQTVRVDGEAIGRLDGFAFSVDPAARMEDRRMLLAAAERHLAVELARRASDLAASDNDQFALTLGEGDPPTISWRGVEVATLAKGRSRLSPRIVLDRAIAVLDPHVCAAVKARLDAVIDSGISEQLPGLVTAAGRAGDLTAGPNLRTILAAVVNGNGFVARDEIGRAVDAIAPEQRQELRLHGITIGTLDLFCYGLCKPVPMTWLAALEAAWSGSGVVAPPPPGIALVKAHDDDSDPNVGFRRIGQWWLRMDLAEKIVRAAHVQRLKVAETLATAAPMAGVGDRSLATAAPEVAAREDATCGSEPSIEQTPAEDQICTAVTGAVTPAPPSNALEPGGEKPKRRGKSPFVRTEFTIAPDLARSIGLPFFERIALLRQCGFRTNILPKLVTPENEGEVIWTWAGRAAPIIPRSLAKGRGAPRSAMQGADGALRHGGPSVSPRNGSGRVSGETPGGGGQVSRRDRRAASRGSDGEARSGDSRATRTAQRRVDGAAPPTTARRQPSTAPNNPFAALATLMMPPKPASPATVADPPEV